MSPDILVVEDDTSIASLLRASLADEGYQVLVAGDGEEALRLVDECTPALILLDVRLPEMDGGEFINAYHARDLDHAPIILLTAAEAQRSPVDGPGVAAYVRKPFDLDELLALIGEYVNSGAAAASPDAAPPAR